MATYNVDWIYLKAIVWSWLFQQEYGGRIELFIYLVFLGIKNENHDIKKI